MSHGVVASDVVESFENYIVMGIYHFNVEDIPWEVQTLQLFIKCFHQMQVGIKIEHVLASDESKTKVYNEWSRNMVHGPLKYAMGLILHDWTPPWHHGCY